MTAARSASAAPSRSDRPSTPRIAVSSSRVRGGRLTIPISARSESTKRGGTSSSAAVRSRHAPTCCATPRDRPRSWRAPFMRHHATLGLGPGAHAQAALLALVGRPLEPAHRLEPRDEHVVQREQVLDVGRGVEALVERERPAGPVGEAVALGEPHVEEPLDERRERRRAHADEAGRDLRVEELRRAAGRTRASRIARSCSAACATITPGPAEDLGERRRCRRRTDRSSAMPPGHATCTSARRGQ